MAGNVLNGSNAGNALGPCSSKWAWEGWNGTFQRRLHGTNYSGSANATDGSNGPSFTGSFSAGGRLGALAGSFFSALATPPVADLSHWRQRLGVHVLAGQL
jgi:hypothetical protein